MSLMTTSTSRSRPYTWEDLETMPDDGRRYEIVDGVLIVTPSPVRRHQRASFRLSMLLGAACPDNLEVLPAPYDVKLADDTVFVPDLLVLPLGDEAERRWVGPPLLAVEILSPSTRVFDLNVKKGKFEAYGCPSFWIVDPDMPSLTVWELRNGTYVQTAFGEGDDECVVDSPFSVTIVPNQLFQAPNPKH